MESESLTGPDVLLRDAGTRMHDDRDRPMTLTDAATYLGCDVKTIARRIDRSELARWPGDGTRKVSTNAVRALVRAELDERKLAMLFEQATQGERGPSPEGGSVATASDEDTASDANSRATLQREIDLLRSALRGLQQAHLALTEHLSIHLD